MNDPIPGQPALPGYRFDDGRNHWRNPIWLIPSTREPEIRTFRTRLAKPECPRHRPIGAEAAICLARCFWLRSSFWATSSTAMAAGPILPLRLRRHRRHRASLQHRLRLPRPPRQRRIRHQKRPARAGLFTMAEMQPITYGSAWQRWPGQIRARLPTWSDGRGRCGRGLPTIRRIPSEPPVRGSFHRHCSQEYARPERGP